MSGMKSALQFKGGEPLPASLKILRPVKTQSSLMEHLTRQNALSSIRNKRPHIDPVGDDEFNSLLANIFASLCLTSGFTDRLWLLRTAIDAAEACPSSPEVIYDPWAHYLAVLNSWLDQLHEAACSGASTEDTA
jgi:hypothetical protein